MTTLTAAHTAPADLSGSRLSFGHLVRAEWIKLRTVRSTMWCFGILVLLTIAMSVLPSLVVNNGGAAMHGADANQAVVLVNTISINLTSLVVAVLGVLIISGEYSTGMIRSTFTADPGRLGAVLAKALVLGVTTFVVSLVSTWIGVLASSPLLTHHNVDVNLGDSSVFLPILGATVYVTLIALLAFGIGLLVRASAGGIAITLGLLLVVPGILTAIGALTNQNWVLDIAQFLPSQAGGQLFAYSGGDAHAGIQAGGGASGVVSLNGWEGFGVLAGLTAAVGIAASVLVKRRDA